MSLDDVLPTLPAVMMIVGLRHETYHRASRRNVDSTTSLERLVSSADILDCPHLLRDIQDITRIENKRCYTVPVTLYRELQ